MYNCCCEYKDQGIEDDYCAEFDSKRVKGRFGLAFVAETPCCCPEPIGWQVEFCDTPSKVEQRCKEMVQWANCPPLPRCEPCPPVEVCSPCFPPRCNPCCPITNPCPPCCPPRCCPCPCPCPPPRRKCCPKMDCRCCPKKPKCCCSSRSKPKCKCKFDDDDDDGDDESRCPCSEKKGDESKGRKKKDDKRAVKGRNSGRDINQRSSFYDDEVPVKESKTNPMQAPNQSFAASTTSPYRNSSQRASTPPRTSSGRNAPIQSNSNVQNLSTSQANSRRSVNAQSRTSSTRSTPIRSNLNVQNLSTPQANSLRSSLDFQSSDDNSVKERMSSGAPVSNSKEEVFVDFAKYYEYRDAQDIQDGRQGPERSNTTNTPQNIVAYVHYEPSVNFKALSYPRIRGINSNEVVNLYKKDSKISNTHFSGIIEQPKSFGSSMHSTSRKSSNCSDSRTPLGGLSLRQQEIGSTVKSSTKPKHKQSLELQKFTAVYSNKDASEFDELLVKRRKWLPYEFLKGVKRRFVGLFSSSHPYDNEDDTESNYSDSVNGDFCNELTCNSKNFEKK